MRVLITGVGGFVGQHLSQHLLENVAGLELHGTVLNQAERVASPHLTTHALDLQDSHAVSTLMDKVRPDNVYHLAAQSSPRLSRQHPWQTIQNNVLSQLNIFQACIDLRIQPRILIASSAEIYPPEDRKLAEDAPLQPTTPYGLSKIAQDLMGLQYFISNNIPVLRARPFNHTGPGQREGFVAPDYAMRIARIEAGIDQPPMPVRGLNVKRDFTDVRDVVRAYQLIIEHGTPGEVYNIASGKAYSVQTLVNLLLSHTSYPVETQPVDDSMEEVSVRWGDATRLYEATGWQPTIPFEQTLLDLLNDCRQRVRRAATD